MEEDAIAYMIAVSESPPGPIMVNMATYVGATQGGFWGALLATTAVVLPAFCIILLVMVLLRSLLEHSYAKAVLRGLKPCIIGIILATGVKLTLNACLPSGSADLRSIVIALILGTLVMFFKKKLKKKLSPIRIILISAVLGILFYGI